MKSIALKNQFARPLLLIAAIIALTLAFLAALPRPANADNINPPPVPAKLQVPAGSKLFLVGHATGTQNYVCLSTDAGFAWSFFGPQATLFNPEHKQVTTHFLSSNPFENGTARPTWQDSKDTSTVWAVAIESSNDPAYVAQGAIPWLLLRVANAADGPTGSGKLTATTYIQRLNTSGGIIPVTGCSASADVGMKALVPYTADYFFYK